MSSSQSQSDEASLEARIAYLNSLTGSLSHEINTPIGIGVTAITFIADETKALIQYLESGSLGKHQLEEYLTNTLETSQTIQQNLERAIELMQSFRDITRDHMNTPSKPVALYQLWQLAWDQISSQYNTQTIQVSPSIAKDLVFIGRPGVLIEIFLNLLSNSLKHGFPEPGTPGSIEVTAEILPSDHKADDTQVLDNQQATRSSSTSPPPRRGTKPSPGATIHIIYKDSGQGINPVQLKHLYRPFFTSSSTEGARGLGMNIVYRLVTRELRGTIHCDSPPGEGVHFDIKFPINLPSSAI
jgi:signal transduction histidine kinase